MATAPSADPRVAAIRRFNRLYTQRIGVLRDGHLGSEYSLTEVRVLFELAHGSERTASGIARTLSLDAGYLSRILHRFRHQRLVKRTSSARDGRESLLALTARGRRVFGRLDARANAEIGTLLAELAPGARRALVASVRVAGRALADGRAAAPAVALREPRAGDYGWIIHRHGVLYNQEYGWDQRFEILVGEIVVKFVCDFVPGRERCWVAELDGEIVGSIFLVQQSRTVGKLRLLYVEPAARGMGIGGTLVDACLDFATAAGYRKVRLWTNSVLDAARRVYERAGFQLVEEHAHRDFGPKLLAQTWELSLDERRRGA